MYLKSLNKGLITVPGCNIVPHRNDMSDQQQADLFVEEAALGD